MDNFTLAVDADGIALVTFDVPGRSMNTISASVQRDLDALVGQIRSDDAIRGAVLCSGKASGFCAGADLTEMLDDIERWRAASSQEDLRAAFDEASGLSRRIRALETCGKPVAAAIGGLALGGGLELALGCHHRVAVDDPKLHLAFPESGIGLLPGAGGTQRLLRLIGIEAAVSHLLDGIPIGLADALAAGVLHRAVPADVLIETARAWVLNEGQATAPWDEKGYKVPAGPHSPAGYQRFGPAIAARHAGAGDHYPATAAILKCLYEGAQVPIDAALRIESRYFLNTARSPQSKAMIRTFFTNSQGLAKASEREDARDCVARLKKAAGSEARAMVTEGVSPVVVANLASLAGFSDPVPPASVTVEPVALEPGDGADLERRFLYAQAIEAARCLEDGTVADPREIDAAAVAAGFPRWTGGPVAFIDMEGLIRFGARAALFAEQYGDRFAVPAGLAARVRERRAFYG